MTLFTTEGPTPTAKTVIVSPPTGGVESCQEIHNETVSGERPRAWPLDPQDTSPLTWWRTQPSDIFCKAQLLTLQETLEQIAVLHGGDDFAAALDGEPSAAVGVALLLMPIRDVTLQADIAMTALLRCVLEGNAAAALVLAQVLGLTDLGHPYAIELATSWFARGRRLSDSPGKFSEAETVLLAAFRDRHPYGDEA